MRAYVQQFLEGDQSYLNFERFAHWFRERDYEVIRFDYSDLDDGVLDRGLLKHPAETIVAGSVKAVRDALIRARRGPSKVPDLPESLKPWIGREYYTTDFGEIRSLFAADSPRLPLHIKPLKSAKLFTGRVVHQLSDLARLGDVDDSEPILVQETVTFVSEWRAYVLRDRIVHVGRYAGDPLLFPDPHSFRNALSAFDGRPIAFSMDWGLTPDGKTLLVEVNDGVALGNYGLEGKLHIALIEARWRQLMGLPDNGIGLYL